MKTTRTKVFETNSSSTHSISISTLPMRDKLPDFTGQTFELLGGEFGWGYDSYDDWQIKANYAAVAIERNNLTLHKEWLIELLKENINCSEVIFKTGVDDYSSYIDHQSNEVFQDSIESKQDLYDFLFKNSKLIIDNDNH